MKFQTVINAEGDLLARTDPQWLAALALHGFTLNGDGEIAQLAAAVPPLSRRSSQIEKNRRQLLEEWTAAHGGATPSVRVLLQIDRRAWALSRPNKPTDLDEETWEATVRDELLAMDPTITHARPPVAVVAPSLDDLDLDLLAGAAVVDADQRSPRAHGRFSMFDLRAGPIRALSRSGVVARRDALTATIDEISGRARQKCIRLLSDAGIPDHLKVFMATETVRLKMRVAARMEGLATSGRSLTPTNCAGLRHPQMASTVLTSRSSPQRVRSRGRVGSLRSPGRPAREKPRCCASRTRALTRQRRRMLVVAPTRKAASVASREVDAAATSLHALLADHGYRWHTDTAGAQVWTRLSRGVADRTTGVVYGGPAKFVLRRGDRIVVDEAGMVDLQTAAALVDLALEHGVGVAMVGDPNQALPVGHAGAMASAVRYATASVELDTVHRFSDPEYAALTLRLRNPRDRDEALKVAGELLERGHVQRVASSEEARDAMVAAFFDWHARGKRLALVSGTNGEADTINDAIQQ